MSNKPIYIVGGRKAFNNPEVYNRGVVLLKDDSGISTVTEYITPTELNPFGKNVIFKGATRADDKLYCCTQNEVVVFALPNFEQVAHYSHPLFAGIHSVIPLADGSFLAGAAVLDSVLLVDIQGNVTEIHNIIEEENVVDVNIDYRFTSKLPSEAHMNHMVDVNGEIFVTRLKKKDAVSLTDVSRKIDIATERAHDGFLFDSNLYFTTVDGTIVVVDPATLSVTDQYTLNTFAPSWCRGLFVDTESSWVGYTRRFEAGLDVAPTRISRYSQPDWMLWDEIDLEPYGMDAIYSIIDAS